MHEEGRCGRGPWGHVVCALQGCVPRYAGQLLPVLSFSVSAAGGFFRLAIAFSHLFGLVNGWGRRAQVARRPGLSWVVPAAGTVVRTSEVWCAPGARGVLLQHPQLEASVACTCTASVAVCSSAASSYGMRFHYSTRCYTSVYVAGGRLPPSWGLFEVGCIG